MSSLHLCERSELHLKKTADNKIRGSDVKNLLFVPFHESIVIVEH